VLSPDFLLTSLIVVLAPGTGVVYTVSTALLEGRRASIAAALGCTFGIVPHVLVSVAGLAALVDASSIAFQSVRAAGVAWLLWLAWVLWHAPAIPVGLDVRRAPGGTVPEPGRRRASSIAIRGMLINLLNPKLSVFFLSFLPQFVSSTSPHAGLHMLMLSGSFMAMTLIVFIGYGAAADHLARRALFSSRTMNWINRVFAVTFAGFALKLAVLDR